MIDITNTNLDAAILDQMVAGEFAGKTYAYVPVIDKAGWALGIAVANQRGYNPIGGKTFKDQEEARQWADSLNDHIGLDRETAIQIIVSTMGGRRFSQVKVSAVLVAKGASQ